MEFQDSRIHFLFIIQIAILKKKYKYICATVQIVVNFLTLVKQ